MPPEPSSPGPHPEPPADLQQRPLPLLTNTGPWFRIHRTLHEPLYFGRSGGNRFDAPGGQYGMLYLADDMHCCFVETYGRLTGITAVHGFSLFDDA